MNPIGTEIPPPAEPQRVYFAARGGHIKIGISTNVQHRMQALGTELLASFPGSFRDEQAMHRRFAEFSVGGEWFLDVPEIRDLIDEIAAPPPVPLPPVRAPDRTGTLTYTLEEACQLIGISVRTAHRLLAKGDELHPGVPAVRIGGRWKIPRWAVDQLFARPVEVAS